MLNALAMYVVAIAPQPATSQALPKMDHLASEAQFEPALAHHTVEWTCPGNTDTSSVRISVTDVGSRWKSEIFELRLIKLVVNGRLASDRLRNRVSKGLTTLNNLGAVAGRCQNEKPALLVTGWMKDDEGYKRREFSLVLMDESR